MNGGKLEPMRELPGAKRRERTWKDEVRDRMEQHKKRRDEDLSAPEPASPVLRRFGAPPRLRGDERAGGPTLLGDDPAEPVDEPAATPPLEDDLPLRMDTTLEAPAEEAAAEEATAEPSLEAEMDAPVAPAHRMELDEPTPEATPAPPPEFDTMRLRPTAAVEAPAAEPPGAEAWPLGLGDPPPAAQVRPPERPARIGERVLAGALDGVVLVSLWSVVLYFASRAARVSLFGLRPAWPYLVAYLALLGLAYAAYFTGTTGQTPGKMAAGLRVVDTAGRPPGYWRAMLRALLGSAGSLLAGLGLLPIVFDPARRAAHDRLLRTRVIKG